MDKSSSSEDNFKTVLKDIQLRLIEKKYGALAVKYLNFRTIGELNYKKIYTSRHGLKICSYALLFARYLKEKTTNNLLYRNILYFTITGITFQASSLINGYFNEIEQRFYFISCFLACYFIIFFFFFGPRNISSIFCKFLYYIFWLYYFLLKI